MPAPVPITIRYGGDPLLYGGLASAAGQAQYGQLQAQREYERWIRQRALDNDFQIAAMNNRTQRDIAMMGANRPSPTAMQEAGGYGRRAAQASGTVTSAAGRQRTPMELALQQEQLEGADLRNQALAEKMRQPRMVPEEGAVSGRRRSTMTLARDGQYSIDDEGRVISDNAEEVVRGRGVSAGRSSGVTEDIRAQLDYMRATKSRLDPDEFNALYLAAKSGQVKMPQLIDDVRAAEGRATGRLTAAERAQDRFGAEAEELNTAVTLPQADQVAYARRKFNMQDPDLYGDDDALNALQSRVRQVTAFLKPVQNSGGRTPTGGNPVPVRSPEEARQLPSGTIVQTPDGRILRVP